jgi:hypothetical protein
MAGMNLKCDLCDDQGPLLLASVCHLTAPLRVTIWDGFIILNCYVPECGREVARFRLADDQSLVHQIKR